MEIITASSLGFCFEVYDHESEETVWVGLGYVQVMSSF